MACTEDTSGEAANREADAIIAESKASMDRDPCLRREGDVYVQRRVADCIELLPPVRMSGVWVLGFEESSFIPGASAVPAPSDRIRFRIFLEADRPLSERLSQRWDSTPAAASLAIEFIGRRSKHPGAYYTGEGDHVVVLDRLISVRYLGPAPEPDFVAAVREGRSSDPNNAPLPESIWE